MINRTIIRLRILQQIYASESGNSSDPRSVEKVFTSSLDRTYDLYFFLLDVVDSLTRLHTELTEVRRRKYLAKEEEKSPNMRLIDNRLASCLRLSTKVSERCQEKGLYWSDNETLLRKILQQIVDSPRYEDYIKSEDSYENDTKFWIDVLREIVFKSEDLDEYIESISSFWDNPCAIVEKIDVEEMPDVDKIEDVVLDTRSDEDRYSSQTLDSSPVEVVKDFVLKSIKKFNPERHASFDSVVIPMFRSEEERSFAYDLLHLVLLRGKEYDAYFEPFLINWEQDRIASIDRIIMRMAITEALHFASIPLTVTINEYIEIAKNFSTNKSGPFINGVLDATFKKLKKDGKLLK